MDAGTGQLDSEVYLGDVFSTPRCLAWSPVGRVLAVGCAHGFAIVGVDSGQGSRTYGARMEHHMAYEHHLEHHLEQVRSITWSPAGELAVSAREGVLIVKCSDAAWLPQRVRLPETAECAAWSPSGEKLALCLACPVGMYVMHARSREIVQLALLGLPREVYIRTGCLEWSPSGSMLACGCGAPRGGLYIVSVDSGEATEVPTDSSRPVQCVAWC